MPRKSYRINQDGKEYTFTPGENGSLTAPDTRPNPTWDSNRPPVAKTVPSPAVESERDQKKVAMNIANTMMKGRLGYK